MSRSILGGVAALLLASGAQASAGVAPDAPSMLQFAGAEHVTRTQANTAATRLPKPPGPGSVSGAPHLPAGFRDTFTSRYVEANGLRMHAVIGGKGPPLLLVHGWPQTWYQWRLVMPALARDFTVIAVDQRGIGLSDKPESGYDAGTQAKDLVALMEALGHKKFAMVGFDTGMPIGYALAADHPDRVERLVVGESPIVGVSPPTPLIVPGPLNKRLWHIPFNRLDAEVNERLVEGREDIYFGAEFAASAGTPLPDAVVKYYVDRLASSPDALRGSFGSYRAIDADIAQNRAAQDPAPDPSRPGSRRRKKHRRRGRENDEARRGQRPDCRHSGQRPLGRRGSARPASGGLDSLPGTVPERPVEVSAFAGRTSIRLSAARRNRTPDQS